MSFLAILGIIFILLFLLIPGMRIHTIEIGTYLCVLVVIIFKYLLLLLTAFFVYLPSKILNIIEENKNNKG